MTEQQTVSEYKVQDCIDDFHNFTPITATTVFCTKCGTPITYKITEAK